MYRVLRYLRVMERVQAAERSKSDTASPPDGPFCMLPASESLSGIQRRGTRRKTRVSRLFTGKPEQHFPTSDMSRIQPYPFNHPTDPMMRSEPTSSVYCYNFGINLLVRRHHRASQTLSQISHRSYHPRALPEPAYSPGSTFARRITSSYLRSSAHAIVRSSCSVSTAWTSLSGRPAASIAAVSLSIVVSHLRAVSSWSGVRMGARKHQRGRSVACVT